MRITAGVILIIAALFNLFASLGYMAGGAASTGVSMVGDQVVQEMAKDGEQLTDQQQQEYDDAAATLGAAGGGFMAFGVFLLISVGILIAGAVFLFQGTKASFILAAGGVAVVAEVIGILLTTFGVTNLIGIVGGVLAIVAAKQMSSPIPEEAA